MHPTNTMIQTVIAKAIFGVPGDAANEYAKRRWGAESPVSKSLVAPITSAANPSLIAGALSRDAFVLAVFTQSILGRLQGLVEVPTNTRVNIETRPLIAPFVGPFAPAPAFAGDFGVTLSSFRRVSAIVVVTQELLRASGSETVLAGQVSRALSRGIDAAFVGSQVGDDVYPAGMAAVAGAAVSGFTAGVEAFTGDLATAAVLANPRTAVALRSAQETQITATGGVYGGFPVITSVAVPLGTLFLVDAARVVASFNQTTIDMTETASMSIDDGTGTVSPARSMFAESLTGIQGTQFVDWAFADGAVVAITLAPANQSPDTTTADASTPDTTTTDTTTANDDSASDANTPDASSDQSDDDTTATPADSTSTAADPSASNATTA